MIGPKSVRLTIASVVALAVAAARAVVVPVAAVAALGPLAALVPGAAGPLAPVAIPRVIFVARRLVAPGQSSGKQCHYQVNQYFFREVRFVLLDSPADRLSRDLRREGARDRGDRDRDRDLRVFGGDSRSLFKLKSSNLFLGAVEL